MIVGVALVLVFLLGWLWILWTDRQSVAEPSTAPDYSRMLSLITARRVKFLTAHGALVVDAHFLGIERYGNGVVQKFFGRAERAGTIALAEVYDGNGVLFWQEVVTSVGSPLIRMESTSMSAGQELRMDWKFGVKEDHK